MIHLNRYTYDSVWTTGLPVVRTLNQSEASKNINQSGLVNSGQTGVHPHLEKHLRRHLETPWLQPFHLPTVEVYRRLEEAGVFSTGQPIILDSGCGTGKTHRSMASIYTATMCWSQWHRRRHACIRSHTSGPSLLVMIYMHIL